MSNMNRHIFGFFVVCSVLAPAHSKAVPLRIESDPFKKIVVGTPQGHPPGSPRLFDLDFTGAFGGGYGPTDVIQSLDLTSAIAAAEKPINPAVAPFVPLAYQFTGAGPSDFFNLKPKEDLVYPFLSPPLNTLFAALDGGKPTIFRSAPPEEGRTETTPQQVAALVKALATAAKPKTTFGASSPFLPSDKLNQFRSAPRLRSAHAGDLSPQQVVTLVKALAAETSRRSLPSAKPDARTFFPNVPPTFNPVGPQSAGLDLPFSPVNDFVLPFLPADKNPFLSLLYYLAPGLRSGQDGGALGPDSVDLAPGQVAKLLKALAAMHSKTTSPSSAAAVPSEVGDEQRATRFGRSFLPFPPAPFVPTLDPLGLLAGLDLLHFRPLNDFVLPFLPADTNPFLSLLYYLAPGLRSAAEDV